MGDDVAAIPLAPGRSLLLTSDVLTEGTHFLAASPPEAVGAAAIDVSLSDLAAKGGTPVAALVDLLLPSLTPLAWALQVTRGAEREAARFGFHVVGGDTKPARSRSVAGFVAGLGTRDLAPRSGARPGDWLVTTGTVGRGGAAARALLRRSRPSPRVLRGLLEVRPRVAEGRQLVGRVHAMLDTSDGLAESARLLAEASRVRIVVDLDRVPFDSALAATSGRPDANRDDAFFGGDYELLAAIAPSGFPAARRAVAASGTGLTVVGRVETGRGVRFTEGGHTRRAPNAGWDPFVRTRPA